MSIESGDYHFAPPYTDKFKEDLLRAIIEKNSSDPSPPSEANIQDLRVHNDNDALDLNSRLVSVAKHIYDVPSRDGKSTSTALQGRINLSEVNEKSLRDENELSLQTFYLSNKGKSHKVQLLRLEEQVDGKFEKHRQEQGNTLSDKFFGTHVARSLSYKTAADEVLSSTEDGRFLTMVEYFLLPNRFKMTPISYSNEHHNEEYLGDDENGFPTFADKAPVDEEELLCPTSFSRNELRVDEDSDGEDDDDIDSIVSRERESIGMCKAMIIFQLTVIGSVRGGKGKKKKKNRRNRTPPRGNIGAVFDGNATDEEERRHADPEGSYVQEMGNEGEETIEIEEDFREVLAVDPEGCHVREIPIEGEGHKFEDVKEDENVEEQESREVLIASGEHIRIGEVEEEEDVDEEEREARDALIAATLDAQMKCSAIEDVDEDKEERQERSGHCTDQSDGEEFVQGIVHDLLRDVDVAVKEVETVTASGNGDVGVKVANELSIETTSAITIGAKKAKVVSSTATIELGRKCAPFSPALFPEGRSSLKTKDVTSDLNFRRDEMRMSNEKSRRGKREETIKAKRFDFDDI